MIPTVVKITREDVTIFLNLNQMIELRVGTIGDKFGIALEMSNGDNYLLSGTEMGMILGALYGGRSDLLVKELDQEKRDAIKAEAAIKNQR